MFKKHEKTCHLRKNKQGKGKLPGTPNLKDKEGREIGHAFFFKGNFDLLTKSFEDIEMSEYQELMVLLKIAHFIFPTQKAVMMDVDLDIENMNEVFTKRYN